MQVAREETKLQRLMVYGRRKVAEAGDGASMLVDAIAAARGVCETHAKVVDQLAGRMVPVMESLETVFVACRRQLAAHSQQLELRQIVIGGAHDARRMRALLLDASLALLCAWAVNTRLVGWVLELVLPAVVRRLTGYGGWVGRRGSPSHNVVNVGQRRRWQQQQLQLQTWARQAAKLSLAVAIYRRLRAV
ncbi:hypothetical protein HK405_015613, partial [Cladochytrium tenue]